jgi:hypothetical protein
MPAEALLKTLIGSWEGTCRTWFEPDKLADESRVSGVFSEMLGGRFIRHTYAGRLQGKPRHGEEWIAFNATTQTFQTSWVDDFHMNYAILFSEGRQSARGFSVRGDYDTGANQPRWGWRTEYLLEDRNHLVITAYNVDPGDGAEYKAVETRYQRK